MIIRQFEKFVFHIVQKLIIKNLDLMDREENRQRETSN